MSNFYYSDSMGTVQGPLSFDELRGLKDSAAIQADTPVIMEGESEWGTYQDTETAIGSIVQSAPNKTVTRRLVPSIPWEMAPVTNPLAIEFPAWDLVPSDSLLVRRRSFKK